MRASQTIKELGKRLLGIRKETAEDVLADLRRQGAWVGEGVKILSPSTTIIDRTAAYLLSIGDYVCITAGVKILTHDYAWSVMKDYASDNIEPGAILGAQSAVTIGNHVFIGMNAIITAGVTIADHVIIGAGSIVTKDCESNAVYAGNPARKICTLDEFYEKRKACQWEEARQIALRYRERMGCEPPKEVFKEHFQLFSNRMDAEKCPVFKAQMERMGSYDMTARYMEQNPPMFENYELFLNACYDRA